MPHRPPLSSRSAPELKRVETMVEPAIDVDPERPNSDSDATLAKWGFSLRDLKPSRPSVLAGTKVPAKYRDRSNPANVWSGRGRAPSWFTEALQAGLSPEDMLIRTE